MIKWILLALLLCGCKADAVSFAWKAGADASYYKLYYGPSSGNYTNHAIVMGTNVTMNIAGPQFFVLTAVGPSGLESLPTYELVWNPVFIVMQHTLDLIKWTPFATNTINDTNFTALFYRLEIRK